MQDKTLRQLEMSRYIDLDLYHEVEKTHPFYVEMIDEILGEIRKKYQKGKTRCKVLELGAGTGLMTEELAKLDFVDLDALELDSECCAILQQHTSQSGCNVIQGDAVTFSKPQHYDLIVSTFAHDHINYDQSTLFAKTIKQNLRKDGIYIMGGEIIPLFTNEESRAEALYKYHGFIINKALRDGHFEVAQIEINALKSGLHQVGDFKRHEEMFEQEMAAGSLNLISKKKIGPQELDNVGGVFVYIFSA
jgi:2-polyprenyl-3-methyl-5-hydroxy-6-metoxy-1,4-benzoquinol methylase